MVWAVGQSHECVAIVVVVHYQLAPSQDGGDDHYQQGGNGWGGLGRGDREGGREGQGEWQSGGRGEEKGSGKGGKGEEVGVAREGGGGKMLLSSNLIIKYSP